MVDQQPDPPLTLFEAAERFSRFLISNGYPAGIRWITADQILLGDDRQHFTRATGAEDALAEAQSRYEVGLKRNLGILLQAICATASETIASVYFPTTATDAQYRRIRPRLKLSCPATIIPAKMVEDPSEWRQLGLDTCTRSETLRETYDL
jgi:hypothetical protein